LHWPLHRLIWRAAGGEGSQMRLLFFHCEYWKSWPVLNYSRKPLITVPTERTLSCSSRILNLLIQPQIQFHFDFSHFKTLSSQFLKFVGESSSTRYPILPTYT
jgi:hypothetical protein